MGLESGIWGPGRGGCNLCGFWGWGSFATPDLTPDCSCKAKSCFWSGSLRGYKSVSPLRLCFHVTLAKSLDLSLPACKKRILLSTPCPVFFLNCEVLSRLIDKLPGEQTVFSPLQTLINSLLYYFSFFCGSQDLLELLCLCLYREVHWCTKYTAFRFL